MHNLDLNNIFGFKPNEDQSKLINSILIFSNIDFESDVFIMSGAAGTGKTTVTKAIIKNLSDKKINIKICAPTNRAAKVINAKTNFSARSIHSEIYTPEELVNGSIKFNRKDNKSSIYTIYIIDEASMISDKLGFGNTYLQDRSLLTELLDYIKQGNSKNKILFIGDKYQLTPINESFSPALDKDYLIKKFNLKCEFGELNKVMRQSEGSEVLSLANTVKKNIDLGLKSFMNLSVNKESYISGAVSKYLEYYNKNNFESVIAICAANSIVNNINQLIRKQLNYDYRDLVEGDIVVVQKNRIDKNGQLLQKGDFGRILSIDYDSQKSAGLNFINAEVLFNHSDGSDIIINCKILTDSLSTPYGLLDKKNEVALIASAIKYNKVYRESKKAYDDEYVNALRLRHGYALTCHQAQGGEWNHVFIHPWRNSYIGAGFGVNLRWTYTAITRAKSSIFSYS